LYNFPVEVTICKTKHFLHFGQKCIQAHVLNNIRNEMLYLYVVRGLGYFGQLKRNRQARFDLSRNIYLFEFVCGPFIITYSKLKQFGTKCVDNHTLFNLSAQYVFNILSEVNLSSVYDKI
jgi:uncharacterized protein YhbP (UPF0306 family)